MNKHWVYHKINKTNPTYFTWAAMVNSTTLFKLEKRIMCPCCKKPVEYHKFLQMDNRTYAFEHDCGSMLVLMPEKMYVVEARMAFES